MPASGANVAVATTSTLAAEAAARIAEAGGNAVDCAIAASMCSINTQPGVCALAGSAFITIWAPGEDPITIDGNVAVPGLGLADEAPTPEPVSLDYGGGVTTLVGASSVAVPGTLAAFSVAAERYAECGWAALLQPSIDAVRAGFPLATACHYFLGYAGHSIYGRSDDGFRALHDASGALKDVGSRITVPHLADTLEAIARDGGDVFYRGEVGERMVRHVRDRGGCLTMADLDNYRAEIRPALKIPGVRDWTIASNPPPAIGGATLAAMLLAFGVDAVDDWDAANVLKLIEAQQSVYRFRNKRLDIADDVRDPVREMLELAASGELVSRYASAATVHTSAVDDKGLACSITASSGYGSGEMPDETGIWLNNCLGELELNLKGLGAGPPGKRLPSNMAPSVGRSKTAVLALGSPGADRITTALHQMLVNFVQRGLDLEQAVSHPRLHVKLGGDSAEVAVEPGLDIPETNLPLRRYPDISMYFGGVAAALHEQSAGFSVAADPRREGGTYVGPEPGRRA